MLFTKDVAERWLIALLCVALGLSCAWMLHEDDIFWQLRAGAELLAGHPVQMVDEWSFTVLGKPWINYQWLAVVLLKWVHMLGGFSGLVVFRIVLLTVFFALLALIIRRAAPQLPWWKTSILLAGLYASMQFRYQLRPELFCLVIFAGQVALMLGPTSKRTIWYLFGLTFLAAQLHTGVAVYNVFLTGSYFAFKRQWLASAGAFAIILLTPIHVYIIPMLITHMGYDRTWVPNTEWTPFTWELFRVDRQGFPFVTWIVLFLLGSFGLAQHLIRKGKNHRSPSLAPEFFNQRWFLVGLFVVTSLLAFRAIRGIPYQIIILLPFIARLSACHYAKPLVKAGAILIGAYLLFSCVYQVQRFAYRWGIRLNNAAYPIEIAEYIRQHNLPGEIFANMGVGSYLLYSLPNYRVFADHRDVIYNDIKQEIFAATNSKEGMEWVTNKYAINTVIVDNYPAVLDSSGNLQGGNKRILPEDRWALLAFDNRVSLFVRRSPLPESFINANALTILDPGIPPVMLVGQFAKSKRVQLEKELERCFAIQENNWYCKNVQAVLWWKHEPAKLQDGLALVRQTYEEMRRTRRFDLQMAVLLQQLATAAGNNALVDEVEAEINKWFGAPVSISTKPSS